MFTAAKLPQKDRPRIAYQQPEAECVIKCAFTFLSMFLLMATQLARKINSRSALSGQHCGDQYTYGPRNAISTTGIGHRQ